MAKSKPLTPTPKTTDEGTDPRSNKCGIVMPISECDGMPSSHWAVVKSILSEAITDVGLIPSLVSDAADVGIIHKRIIENLYYNPLVVCDVSGGNPNVMFELGLRLAFDKATVIVKDDQTRYPFDTSLIEYLPYRRDLRYYETIEFKKQLTTKLKATLDQSRADKNYSQFVRALGNFEVVKLNSTEVTANKFMMNELAEIRRSLNQMSIDRDQHEGPYTNYPGIISSERIQANFDDMTHRHIVKYLESVPHDYRRKPLDELLASFLDSCSPIVKKLYSTRHQFIREQLAVVLVNGYDIDPPIDLVI